MLERRFPGAAIALATAIACSLPLNSASADSIADPNALPPAVLAISEKAKEPVGPVSTDKPIDAEKAYEAALSPSTTIPLSSFDIDQAAPLDEMKADYEQRLAEEEQKAARLAALDASDKLLAYDPEAIAAIGNQASSGHTICCPGYACAYGDAIVQGTPTDHAAYGCGMCTWPGWGGGNSSFRSLSSNEALLREAYDQIAAGKPTVIHVAGAYGEHWITLIGYHDASDPDNLELGNFTALDPYDGTEINAGEAYALYGDFCEHVSSL